MYHRPVDRAVDLPADLHELHQAFLGEVAQPEIWLEGPL